MKKYLLIILILIPYFLFSYTIEETLSQIESLKKELSHNEQIVEEKISNLKKSNPLFAGQDPFEPSREYAERIKKGQSTIDNIRKQYLDDLWQKLGVLRGRLFETENVSITLGNYDPDAQMYPIIIKHLDYQREIFNVDVNIKREKAKILYENWDKVKKTGILTIDIGDKVGLAKMHFYEPISGFAFTHEFQPMISINYEAIEKNVYELASASFSPDGRFLAVGSFNVIVIGKAKHIFLYDLLKNRKIVSIGNSYKKTFVKFSKDSKYLIAEWGENPNSILIYDIKSRNINKDIQKINDAIFSKTGEFICSIDKVRTNSPDNKYEVKCEGKYANIYRTSSQAINELLTQEILSRPPSLSTSVSFYEPSGNKYLDALEKGEIQLTVTNNGEGPGKGLTIKFEPERIEGLNYNNSYVEEIPAQESVTVSIPIEAYIDVKDNTHLLRINFDEINGFPPAPVEIQISTKSYEKPEMFIADVGIKDSNGDGKIESGEMIELTLRFANQGKGLASGSYAKFYPGNDVFITDTYPKTVKLGDLEYGEFVDIPLEFFVNDRTVEEIPLFVDITEATGLATVNKLRLPILKSDKTREIRRTVVTGIDKDFGDLEFGEDLSIDIEQNIPQISKTNENALAIIFGIENYKNVSDVSFAHRDANFVKEYFEKTLGIKNSNIYFKTNENVTKAEFYKVFSKDGWLDKRVKQGKTEIYFYYAGHGAPEIKQNKAYLIPYDGDPNYASQTGYEMDEIYANLADLKAKSVTVFLDACFSGANRENEMLLADARPIMIEVEGPVAHGITVFSATSGKEISSAWPEKKHGLFTYFLLKGFQGNADINADKQITIGELENYILQNVSETAGFLDREQTPTFIYEDKERVLIEYE